MTLARTSKPATASARYTLVRTVPLVAERRIPYVEWGHLLRFDPDEIDEWLARGRVPAER